jgi:hypothetical protein
MKAGDLSLCVGERENFDAILRGCGQLLGKQLSGGEKRLFILIYDRLRMSQAQYLLFLTQLPAGVKG